MSRRWSLRGYPTKNFASKGFYLKKKGRATRLAQLAEEPRTIIFYESPFRLLKTLTQFKESFGGEREASVSREISKLHEETVRGNVDELIAHFSEHEPKGEIVIIVAGAPEKPKETKKNKYSTDNHL